VQLLIGGWPLGAAFAGSFRQVFPPDFDFIHTTLLQIFWTRIFPGAIIAKVWKGGGVKMALSRLAALVVCFALGACASAQDFQQPIGDFATATSSATTALQSLDQTETANYNALALSEALKDPSLIASRSGDCRLQNSTGCTVVVKPAEAGGTPLPLGVKSLVPNSIQIMTVVANYANALKTLSTADSTPAVQDGLGKTLGAAVSVASTINAPMGSLISAIQQPLTQTGVYLFQQYQNAATVDAMRRATTAADPVIQQAMGVLSDEYIAVQNAAIARASDDYEDKLIAARAPGGGEAAINALIASANTFDDELKLRNTNIYAQVATAHQQLTQALQDPDVSLTDAIAQIQVLVQQIKNVQTIAADIQAANKPPVPAAPQTVPTGQPGAPPAAPLNQTPPTPPPPPANQ